VGDTLAAGRQIGEVGNSGSSTAPHLHFQVMDRPSTLDAVGLPFVFDRQRVEGRVVGTPAVVDEAYEAGRPVRTDTAGAGGRADRMPAEGQIFAFHGP
jgi:murein DD-endopeptidase MepM/ murein hydrolase activator NlpD